MAADGAGERGRGAAPGCTVNPLLRPAATYDGEPPRDATGSVDAEHEILLQGRGQVRCPLTNRHTFSSIFSSTEGVPVPTAQDMNKAFFSTCKSKDPRTYCIKTAGYDLLRVSLEPAAALRQDQLQNVPAGTTRLLKSQLKLGIDLYDYADRRPIIIDWGQEVEVLSESISLHVFGPSGPTFGIIYLPPDNERRIFDLNPSNLRSGHIIDSVLNASVWAAEEARGLNTAWLTTTVSIAATTQPVIEIPTNALSVTGYQSPIGAASASWSLLVGPAATGAIGSFPWAARRTVEVENPLVNASHLLPDIDPVNTRIFTLRWKIQL